MVMIVKQVIMNNRPVEVRNIDANKISFVPGQAKAGRNPSINLKYDGQNLQILLPRMAFPGGVIVRDNEQGGTTYTLIGSLKGCDPYAKDHSEATDDMSKFYNLLLDLEDSIVAVAVENSVKWFGKKRSEEAIRDGFKRILSVSTDKIDGEYVPNGKYPPSFRAKLPVYDNRVSSEIVDGQRNPVYATPESLVSVFPKGVEARLVVSGSIYVIAGGGFGVTWRLQSAQVFPRAKVTAADIFAAEEEEVPPTTATQDVSESKPADEERPATPEDQPVTQAAPTAPQRKRRAAA
jgi:hypothetical protein